MTNVELYINSRLCDVDKSFGVRLNRQLLKPGELNTKDAQYSYSITLPGTAANNAVFGYANIEETRNKFNKGYRAELIINSVRVFVGNFLLTEVSQTKYKGNLYVPAAKSIKDIFGETKLNENPECRLYFNENEDFAGFISRNNQNAANGSQMAIFPYVLYGVLPKVPLTLDSNNYSARNIWDTSVRMGIQDIAPSINILKALDHIFRSRKLRLTGTAFDDERLARLYMSYKNENNYVQPWNYGYLAFMKIRGYWSNVRGNLNKFERNGYQTDYDGQTYYSSDLLDATNTDIDLNNIYDPGANILVNDTNDNSGQTWTQCQVRIPSSGFYKVHLKADLSIDKHPNGDSDGWRGGYDGMQFVGGDSSDDRNANSFRKKRYEIKLLRDRGTGDFGLANGKIDRVYYRDNLNQNETWDEENLPKHFPSPGYSDSGKYCETMIVDPAQNPNYVVGMAWGNRHSNNPLVSNMERTDFGTILAAKTGLSWDVSANPTNPAKVGLPNVGYMKYGPLGNYDDDSENPNMNIDYSGGEWVYNKGLDDDGNLVDLPEGVTSIVLRRFLLPKYSTFNLIIPPGAGYTGKVFIHRSLSYPTSAAVYEFDENGKLSFDSQPSSSSTGSKTFLSMYLNYDDAQPEGVKFDISESLVINRTYDTEGDAIDWEQTKKFKMTLNNAPESYASRGWHKGNYINNDWYASGEVNAIVWLDAGELLTIASVSDQGRYKRHSSKGKYGWTKHAIDFELDIAPFRTNEDWLKVNSAGNGIGTMDWDDDTNFDTDSIDLVKFLPADVKTDDFIENFCKAFNLILSQTGTNSFSLDVKQTKAAVSSLFINLDNLASVKDRSNQPLGLPSLYRLGFTVDQEEEGYVATGEDGGGSFETGAIIESIAEQKSNFSYNWFKDITKVQTGGNVVLPIPIISKAEVWASTMTYPDAMKKRYSNLAARFWYFDGLLNDLGANFEFNKEPLKIAKVSNTLPNRCTLNYKRETQTILDNFFTLLIDAGSHYTEIEGYLTPQQYEQLDGAIMAMFNGDQYYVAELSGYDPLGRNKTKIKLIRKI